MVIRIRLKEPALKDIRPDLEVRLSRAMRQLDTVDAEYDRAVKALSDGRNDKKSALKVEIEAIRAMIEAESRRFGETAPSAPIRRADLDDYLENLLRPGPKTKSDLKDKAVAERRAADGRAVHFTLLNMKRSGRVQELPDGRYRLPEAKQKVLV